MTLVSKLIEEGYDIIGFPRLVRLNPNIPWKTRGNGAISIHVGAGIGKRIKIGETKSRELFSYSDKKSSNHIDEMDVSSIVEEVVDSQARLDDENTNSGFVILKKQPSYNVYMRAVREIVLLDETREILDKLDAFYKGYKNCRGIIGATASIAWDPINDKTFELITYREKSKWGSKRFVDDDSTIRMDKKIVSTFDNFDYENKHNRLVPNSPCPVLFGIRGEKPIDLVKAKSIVRSERIDGWMIFETNQGTDDHLQKKKIKDIIAYDSVIVRGTIINSPHTIKGGHVIFTIKDETGSIDCAAYEPTKEFRNIIRQLTEGDVVEVYGGVRKKPLTINLEKIGIKKLVKKFEKLENPVCPKCGKHMKSKGKNQGFKCKKCGISEDKPVLREEKRLLIPGLYEVPICARRHLSKPLKRFAGR